MRYGIERVGRWLTCAEFSVWK